MRKVRPSEGKGKREREKGKVRAKDWPSRGREGRGRGRGRGRKPAASSQTVDDELQKYVDTDAAYMQSGGPNWQ